jgi:nicotinamidase-related amidase
MDKIILGPTDALAIIDGQNDFAHPRGALYSTGFPGESSSELIAEHIEGLIIFKPFGYRVATFDEHPDTGHIEFGLYGRHVVKGTWGAQYIDRLRPLLSRMDFLSYKGENAALISYSIMVSASFGQLVAEMRAKGIKRVFVAGWMYTHCAGLSAIAFATQGFKVFMIRDATLSVPAHFGGDPARMATQLAFDGVKEITMADIA